MKKLCDQRRDHVNFREGDGQNQLLGNSWAEQVVMLGTKARVSVTPAYLLPTQHLFYIMHHKTFRKGTGPSVMPH